jgi:CubicO group peptidase (beta-lactamase class C family)
MESQVVLEQVARESMANNVPGLSMALVSDGQVRWASALGVKHAGEDGPVSHDTLFEAASLSKPPFALGVLLLCERGELELDVPLTSYVEERIVRDDPRLNLITARMVLSHTTGFPNWRKGDLTISADPGIEFGYSGEGFMYLQKAVERITGVGLEEFMKANVMDPLGMTRSSYLFATEGTADVATGHDKDGAPRPKRQWPDAMSAASLHTTPTDYCRFLAGFMAPGDALSMTADWLKEALKAQTR